MTHAIPGILLGCLIGFGSGLALIFLLRAMRRDTVPGPLASAELLALVGSWFGGPALAGLTLRHIVWAEMLTPYLASLSATLLLLCGLPCYHFLVWIVAELKENR